MHKRTVILILAAAFSGQALAGGKFFPGFFNDKVTYAGATAFSGETVAGMSSIVRTDDEFGISFNTRELSPDHAYTVWVAAFNNPHKCLDPCNCGGADVSVPEVETGMFMASGSGRVADGYGQANFDAIIPYNELPQNDDQVLIGNPPVRRAQLFLILRDHGPANADAEVLEEQLSTYSGGCDSYACEDVVLTQHTSPYCKAKHFRNSWSH